MCDLYLHKPAGSIVVCVDEKTAIGARSRKHPEHRAAPGRAARREFEYIRHGTVSIIAALDVHSGQVITEAISHNNSATFISFLTMLDEHLDPGLTIHLVLDLCRPRDYAGLWWAWGLRPWWWRVRWW